MNKAVINLIHPEQGNVTIEYKEFDAPIVNEINLININNGQNHNFDADDEIKIVIGESDTNTMEKQIQELQSICGFLSKHYIEYSKIEVIFLSSDSFIPKGVLWPQFMYHYIKTSEFGNLRSCYNLTRLQEYSWSSASWGTNLFYNPIKVDSYGCSIELLNQVKNILSAKPITKPSMLIIDTDVYDLMFEDVKDFINSYFVDKKDYIKIVLDENDFNDAMKENGYKFDNCFFLTEYASGAEQNNLISDKVTCCMNSFNKIHIISSHYDIIQKAYVEYQYSEFEDDRCINREFNEILMNEPKIHFYIPDVFSDDIVLDKEIINQKFPNCIDGVDFDAFEFYPNQIDLIHTQVGKEISC